MNDDTMPPKYENTLGERAFIIIVVSFLSLMITLLSIGVLLVPAFKAAYQAIFYHMKHDQKQDALIKTYFNALNPLKHELIYSIIFVGLLIILIGGFIVLEGIFIYVIIYFLMFETLLMLLNAPPLLEFMELPTLKTLLKTVFLLGHLHTLPTLLHIGFIVLSVVGLMQLSFIFTPLLIFPLVVIYFSISSSIYYKVLKTYK